MRILVLSNLYPPNVVGGYPQGHGVSGRLRHGIGETDGHTVSEAVKDQHASA